MLSDAMLEHAGAHSASRVRIFIVSLLSRTGKLKSNVPHRLSGNTCYVLCRHSFKVLFTASQTHGYSVWLVTQHELDITDPVELGCEGIQAVRVKVFSPLLIEIIQRFFC